ncbi:MAG: 50S ribosomal protein L30 [Mariprofundaceae bacterium]|nr:50S ribosomal protein L30 [Mariprofundaceae bacterium]
MAKKSVIRVRQIKSAIGYSKDQKATLTGLGFRRLNQTVELEDTPSVRGMVNKVRHLVRIEDAA